MPSNPERIKKFVHEWLWDRTAFSQYMGAGAGIALVVIVVTLIAYYVFGVNLFPCEVGP